MRRTVAMLLVVASPLLFAGPVEAGDRPTVGGAAPVATPTVPAPAVPSVVPVAVPAVAAPAVAAPAVAAPAVAAPAAPIVESSPATPAPVRQAVKPAGAKARRAAAGISDSAYSARLQAQLCAARQIFCGLDRNGRYPGR